MAKKEVKKKMIDLSRIQATLDSMKGDVGKFNNGVKAAGSRVRKGAQEIKVACQNLRKDVSDIKNAM